MIVLATSLNELSEVVNESVSTCMQLVPHMLKPLIQSPSSLLLVSFPRSPQLVRWQPQSLSLLSLQGLGLIFLRLLSYSKEIPRGTPKRKK